MVTQAWETSQDATQLSNRQIEGIIQLWNDYLVNEKNDIPHKDFKSILRKLLQLIDETGVVYGTIKDLEHFTNTTNYKLAKNFHFLAKHGLLFRRNGIIVINTDAFEKDELNKVTKDYFT